MGGHKYLLVRRGLSIIGVVGTTCPQQDTLLESKGTIYSLGPHREEEQIKRFASPTSSIFRALVRFRFKQMTEMRTAKQFWPRCGPAHRPSWSLSGLQAVLQGVLKECRNCVKSPGRQAPPLAGSRRQPLPSLNRRFLGKFWFLGVHCLNSLQRKGGAQVSL